MRAGVDEASASACGCGTRKAAGEDLALDLGQCQKLNEDILAFEIKSGGGSLKHYPEHLLPLTLASAVETAYDDKLRA